MGDARITIKGLTVARVDAENNILMIRGAVPGANGSVVVVRKTTKMRQGEENEVGVGMPTVKVRNIKNEEVGEVELSDAVFGAPLNEGLIHAAVRNFMANARQGTSATKTRGDVSGAGRKLWKQKGTGRARIASLRSPLWKGGGNVHGPQPRDWSYNMPKKMRQGALRSALSERVREGNVFVVDGWTLDKPKTKDFSQSLSELGIGRQDVDRRFAR